MGRFGSTPAELYRLVKDPGARDVFTALAMHADFKSWRVRMSLAQLASFCSIARSRATQHVGTLVKAEVIERVEVGKGQITTYQITLPMPNSQNQPDRNTGRPKYRSADIATTGRPEYGSGGDLHTGQDPTDIQVTYSERRETRGESEGLPLSNLSGESEPITAEAIEKRLGLPGGGWRVIRQWFARDCTFDRWIEFQHAETNPEAFEALLADWSKRDPADRSRPAPNGLRVQLEAGPLRYYRDELRRQAHHERQRQAEREADEAAKRRNGGGHLPAEARRALRAQLGFLAAEDAEDAEGETETQRREHRPSEQGLTPIGA